MTTPESVCRGSLGLLRGQAQLGEQCARGAVGLTITAFFLCKAKEILNDTIKQLNLIGIFRTLHKKKKTPRTHILFKHT